MKPDDLPPPGALRQRVVRWRGGERGDVDDWLTDEVPVAFEFNGISHAVMLATPADLEDFALGFALCEAIIDDAGELFSCEAEPALAGWTVKLEISSRSFMRLKERRRTLAGRTGCGICGTESLDQALRPAPTVHAAAGLRVAATAISRAMDEMKAAQVLCRSTGSVHAAAWCAVDGALLALREDVGRHNALDKLVGAMARARVDAAAGFIAVTSRASVEMVQKACIAGAPLLAAVSAPTTLAVRTADAAGLTLVGLVRGADLVIYAHPDRIALGEPPPHPLAGIN